MKKNDEDDDYIKPGTKKGMESEEESVDESEEDEENGLFTESQKKEYNKAKELMRSKNVAALKEMLKLNDQKCVGSKDELVERVAECKVKYLSLIVLKRF